MKTLELEKFGTVSMEEKEMQQINGGADGSKTSIWQDIAYLGASIARGLEAFGTEGGRNAGISAR